MGRERIPGAVVVGSSVLAISAAVVITLYGWYPALNAVVPLFNAVLWLSVLAVASWGAGRLVCRWKISDTRWTLEDAVLVLLAGTAVLMATAGVLGILHLLYPPVLLAALACWACYGGLLLYRQPPLPPTGSEPSHHIAWVAVGVAGAVSLAAATTFAPFYDQWHYHLGFPYQWLRAGTIITFPRHAYSFFPSNMGLLYLFPLASLGGWAAQVVHWWMGLLTAGGAAAVARRLGARGDGQVLTAALFLATPSVVQLAALAGADLGVAAFGTGAVIALLRLRDEPKRAILWATASGLLAGLAGGSKYLALASVVVPAGLVLMVISIVGSRKRENPLRAVKVFVGFALGTSIFLAPWLVRNALQTGNPVHPYFAGIFHHETAAAARSDLEIADGIGDFELTPDKLGAALTFGTFSPRGQSGNLGPVHLWLLPLVLLWVWRRRRDPGVLIVSGTLFIGLAAWALGPPLGRYLLPTVALASALGGAAWTDVVNRLPTAMRIGSSIFLVAILAANCNPIRGEYLYQQIECFLGAANSEEYLESNCTQVEAFRAADQKLPLSATVLLVAEPRPYAFDRDLVVEDGFRKPMLVELAETTSTPDEIAAKLRQLGVSHLLWNSAEAKRIAKAEQRTLYLECETPAAQDRLDRFLEVLTQPVVHGAWWEIRALPSE